MKTSLSKVAFLNDQNPFLVVTCLRLPFRSVGSGWQWISEGLKETKSATMNIFEKKYFRFKSFVKVELSYVFTINQVYFPLLVIICVPPIIIDS